MFSASKTAGPSGYNISRSVRLRSSASAYFSRTPASVGNRQIFTYSAWVKRGLIDSGTSAQYTLMAAGGSGGDCIMFSNGNLLSCQIGQLGVSAGLISNNTYRDPSAWYHVVVAVDTTQATAANRVKMYVNNQQITSFAYNNLPSLNQNATFNTATEHDIGRQPTYGYYFDGYLTEINWIDGQALTPSSFGSTNATTGVWQPARYTGTYGTNGFYLNFSDNSAATAAAIGKDYSGNGNNWTPNNISVTAGSTYDSMIDVPTPYADGSTNRGNYCTWNPLVPGWSSSLTNYPEGNLSIYGNGTQRAIGTQQIPTTGKWYFEIQNVSYGTSGGAYVGVTTNASDPTVTTICMYVTDGTKYVNGSSSAYGSAYGSASGNTDVIGVAVDNDAGTVTFYKNGVSQGSITHGLGNVLYPSIYKTGVNAGYVGGNFGQRPFAQTPPTGFKALNTYNLPASTVLNGGKYMAATLYTGNGSTQSVTNAGSFKPDLVWYKDRSVARDHSLFDSVRGVNLGLSSNLTNAESSYSGVSAFNSTGFSLGNSINGNASGETYVGWQWQAGQGSTSSNTNGSITSTVSVNATAGFSVVTWAGNSGTNATIGHGLGVAPKLIITKNRGGVTDWPVYHSGLSSGYTIFLDLTNAQNNSSAWYGSNAPTSSVFYTTYPGNGSINASGSNYVTYCWSEIAGFSKFGSYTGNGSTDGPFVYLGFRPRYVLVKCSSAAYYWVIEDSTRDPYNAALLELFPNASDAETNASRPIDFLSNGFKIRNTGTPQNASGQTYIFAAFAENPFANALAR